MEWALVHYFCSVWLIKKYILEKKRTERMNEMTLRPRSFEITSSWCHKTTWGQQTIIMGQLLIFEIVWLNEITLKCKVIFWKPNLNTGWLTAFWIGQNCSSMGQTFCQLSEILCFSKWDRVDFTHAHSNLNLYMRGCLRPACPLYL